MTFEEQAAIEHLPGVDPDSFQAYRHNKLRTTMSLFENEEQASLNILGSLLVSEPGDRLSRIVQHCDLAADRASIIEFVSSRGPLRQAQQDLHAMLFRKDGLSARAVIS